MNLIYKTKLYNYEQKIYMLFRKQHYIKFNPGYSYDAFKKIKCVASMEWSKLTSQTTIYATPYKKARIMQCF